MALTVRCKGKALGSDQAMSLPVQIPGVSPLPAQTLPCPQVSTPCGCSQNTGFGGSPVIIQAPQQPAPIIIQAPAMFKQPLSVVPTGQAQTASGNKNQRAQGVQPSQEDTSMPVLNADQSIPLGASIVDTPSSDDYPHTQGRKQSSSREQASSRSEASAPPIIININNSQDTASNNRSLFAPNVHDESLTQTRLRVGANARRARNENESTQNHPNTNTGADSPVPVVKTPIPETTPGASGAQISTDTLQPASSDSELMPAPAPASTDQSNAPEERFVLVRRGRLVHVKPVRATVLSPGNAAAQQGSPAPQTIRMYHYVGWS